MGLEHMCGTIRLPIDLENCTVLLVPTAAVVSLVALYKLFSWRNRKDVRDKVVLITGASSGIGKACASVFYKAGAKVILASRTESRLNQVKEELVQSGPGHVPEVVTIDMADYQSIRQSATSILSRVGHVDILINNAGQGFRGAAIDTDISLHEQIMKVNYFGQIVLTRELLPAMIKNGGGDIVVISSLQGKLYVPYRSAYGASKHALECYFDILRAEHYDDKINVCVCSPGFVKTEIAHKALKSDGTPLGESDEEIQNGMQPEYVAEQVLRGVQYRTKHMLLGSIHHTLACYLPNIFWNVAAWIMVHRAKTDRFRPKKTN